MATSTIPTLKGNLVTQLKNRAGLTGVQVSYGPPFPNPQRELIMVGSVRGDQEYAAMGANRHESYDLDVIIAVLREGTDAQAADTRCFQIFAEVENEIRGNPTINTAVESSHLAGFQLEEGVSPDGMNRESRLTVQLNCQAWI